MAVLANGILVLRAGLLHDSRPLAALAVVVLLAAAFTIGYGARRKALLAAATRPPSISAVALALVATAAWVACLVGLFAIWVESAAVEGSPTATQTAISERSSPTRR
jgi:drug/metabolite transporter (DMT)-like permease